MDSTKRMGSDDTVPLPITLPVPLAAASGSTEGTGPNQLPDDSDEGGPPEPAWVTVADGAAPPLPPLPERNRMLLQLGLAALAVLTVVLAGSAVAASRLAEREAVNGAAKMTDLLAVSVVQPALVDELVSGDPAAYDAVDSVMRERVLPNNIVRVKLWTPDGRVIYSDERRLVGQRFQLGDEQLDTLAHPRTQAEVSDLQSSENTLERPSGRLVEVYRPVWTPSGAELLFEVYGDYTPVAQRASDLWRGFAGLLTSAILLLLVLMTPVLWQLLSRLRAAQQQREALLQQAVDASDQERRRIASDLHDGPVQDLAGSALAVAGAAELARASGRSAVADTVDDAARMVRSSIASLRSLLVDIYPPRLADAGLAAALADLARPLAARGIAVDVAVDAGAADRLDPGGQRLAHRIATECLRNVVRHSRAHRAGLSLRGTADAAHPVVLTVTDDGVGFDPRHPAWREGHFGIRSLIDLATEAGAILEVASTPGGGTSWRARLPAGSAS